jgi:hypothetical protein
MDLALFCGFNKVLLYMKLPIHAQQCIAALHTGYEQFDGL